MTMNRIERGLPVAAAFFLSLVVSSAWGFTGYALVTRRTYATCSIADRSPCRHDHEQISSIFTFLRSSRSDDDDNDVDDDEEDNDEPPAQPPQNWLQSLKEEADEATGRLSKPPSSAKAENGANLLTDEEPGNVNIPSTGVSVGDALVDSQRDEFKATLGRVKGVAGVAKIETESKNNKNGSTEPVRYLVALSPPAKSGKSNIEEKDIGIQLPNKFALVDVPPYSDKLAEEMRSFMGETGRLATILVTNRDSLHYDESPAVYVTRKSDMAKWMVAFPGVKIAMYRLDIPRDCRDIVTQRLDGYGPWALDEGTDGLNATFIETGRPLTVMEWDEDTRKRVMEDGETPPDDEAASNDDELYTPKAIRQREQGKRILAIYTPGRTFGSVSFVFPEIGVCCSGYAIPIEDTRLQDSLGMGAGPKLDYTGYVTTSVAGVKRQAESAKHLIRRYSDRFTAVLPANGETVTLGGDAKYRAGLLLDIVSQYEKIGKIYDELGIM